MPSDKLFEQLSRLRPPESLSPHLRSLVAAALAKMDLVSREEFDAQAAVLARTRAKLEALEAQLAQLQRKPE
ncbi:accessory factor UbiK family protein [Simiduia agarivorans]|uniref:Ubiquinone biosynthesis accessory factor UbiK n=1 Tax=Simiduia agarivorans (strain DSM 21679 / JCM 13881 / BCRC 17597 / SA1) TaxID=1117647 RepID=K4KKV0_SIMAS|nr:accessory factor UbiK family protein [Simiduia agarivorans]AFU99774.1 hypothetical protein M5M_13150 [Simiduia agarivorans SA1 = DSM 21679]